MQSAVTKRTKQPKITYNNSFKMILSVLAIKSAVVSVNANNIPELDFMCTPCVNFGGFYCYDDPWKVNFNGDKCYENAVDRLNCDNFQFTNDVSNCVQGILSQAS